MLWAHIGRVSEELWSVGSPCRISLQRTASYGCTGTGEEYDEVSDDEVL